MRKIIAGVVALLSFKGVLAAQESKQINYRGGLAVFSLPDSWTEEYEPEGGGVFYAPGEDTGTLRLDVITAKSPNPAKCCSAGEVLSKIGHPQSEYLPAGYAMSKHVSWEMDRGVPITIYWWYVASAVEPDHVRIASFSYSVMSSQERTVRTLADLSFLESSIRNIRFNPVLGE